MRLSAVARPRVWVAALGAAMLLAAPGVPAQQAEETRDPAQAQDADFARAVGEWTTGPAYTSPLVDHLPVVPGVPSPKEVLGHHVGAPGALTYYADILKYYRALAAATPRVRVETIGRSDEDRELVVVWVSSDENIRRLQENRDNLARLADPRGLSPDEARALIAATRPQYHLMGGLHSGETGPSEMLMELVYRLATETSPLVTRIRDQVIVSVTPVADPDGRDRYLDWFYQGLELKEAEGAPPAGGTRPAPAANTGSSGPPVPYWGKYVYHDNNRDINLSQQSMRAIADWYFTAHPPIVHDLHEAQPLMYTYSGAAPQNPNLDPILFAELPWFASFELAQMTKWGMPGVYTHAFMDGWSPGYLGSLAYNHNGMMRMYETQSGVDLPPAAAGDSAAPAATVAGRGRSGRASGQPAPSSVPAGRGRATTSRPAAGSAVLPARPGGRSATAPAGAPTGRGGSQPREWYRGLPIPPGAQQHWSRRNNATYMETGVLSALQLTAAFPGIVLENFYRKTVNSIEAGRQEAPYAFVIPVQRDMTRVADLVNLLRLQRIEVGRAAAEIKVADGTFPAGSYVVKRDQPYGRLAKNLLERQEFPDPNLRTYDDSGWTMGLALMATVTPVSDKAILEARTVPVDEASAPGHVTGTGAAGLAVAHYGSNNMIALRYRLRTVPMKIADRSFTAQGLEFPAGSFIVTPPADLAHARTAIESLGLTAVALKEVPTVPAHDADAPRVAIYSPWSGTQDPGWVRYAFDRVGVPYDLIYKERLHRGRLRADYDVIVLPSQNLSRQAVFQPSAARPVPYRRTAKYQFLGMYGETDDVTGGMGGEGVDAFSRFLDAGGTLIAMGNAARFPADFGLAQSVDASDRTSSAFYAPRPIVQAEIVHRDHPVFYGYPERLIPVKYFGGPLVSVGGANQAGVLARYVGGDDAVLSGLMRGADEIRQRPMAVDVPGGFSGKGRVVLFANNPVYRWQTLGEFNMVFNALMNWNDLAAVAPADRGEVEAVGAAAPGR